MDNISMERLAEVNKRRNVPGLHPGLNELIRVLGKQAHCVSRTMILCEPHIPVSLKKTKYHKNCSPDKRNSSDSFPRPGSLIWSPVRQQQYYYDCFNYSHYPERETEYQDIENRYQAVKDKPMNYVPPKCDEGKIRRSLESPDVRHRKLTEHLVDTHPHEPKTRVDELAYFVSSSQSAMPVLQTSSEEVSRKKSTNLQDSSSRQSVANKPTDGDGSGPPQSVPCSELTDIRDLLRKNERESFERMQEMLTLMKELSAKNFCRATCDRVDGERHHEISFGKLKDHGSKVTMEASADHFVMYESSDPVVIKKKPSEFKSDSSTTSVESSSGVSKQASKSKSSVNQASSSSKESSEQELHESGEETSSDDEGGRPTESESDESMTDKSGVSKPTSESGGSTPSRNRSEVKMQVAEGTNESLSSISKSKSLVKDAKSKDSVRDAKSRDSMWSSKSKDSARDRPKKSLVCNNERDEAPKRFPSAHDNGTKPILLNVCDSPMTIHELVEVSNIITDIVVLETVNELIQNGKYTPPSKRPSMVSEGTRKTPFEVKGHDTILKPIISDPTFKERSVVKDMKSVSLPRASELESYKASKEVSPLPDDTHFTESSRASKKSDAQPTIESPRTSKKPDMQPNQRESRAKSTNESTKSTADSVRSRNESIDAIFDTPKSKMSKASTADSIGSKDRASMKSKETGESRAQSIKSNVGDESKVGSLTSRGTAGPLKSGVSESFKAETKTSEGSKVDAAGSKVDHTSVKSKASVASAAQSIKSKQSEPSKVESLKSRTSEEANDESKTSGGSKADATGSKVDHTSMKSKASVASAAQSIKSKQGEDSKAHTLKSRTSEEANNESKTSGGSKADATGSKVDHTSMKSKASVASAAQSIKSKQGEDSKAHSLKSEVAGGSSKSGTNEESRAGSKKSDLSTVESAKGEPGFESAKSKLAEESKAESMKSRGTTSAKSTMSDQSKAVSTKSKGGEESGTNFEKPRLSEAPKQSSESSWGTAKPSGQPKTTTILKPISELFEPSNVPRIGQYYREVSEPSRTGHRRSSSCSSGDRSPSCSPQGSRASSRATYASGGIARSKDVVSSSSLGFQKDRRVSTLDSVCEREDSIMCDDYETDNSILYYVRITDNAFPPEKESYNAAGFMLKSAYDYTIPPRGQVIVKTDLVLELPPNSYGRITARRCLAINYGIDVGADVIDRDCQENVTILLFNHSDKPFCIRKGNKVAQLICESIQLAAAKEKCDLINTLGS